MNGALPLPLTQQKATVASRVVGIIFDHLASLDHCANLGPGNHPIWSQHLAQSVRKKENLRARCVTDLRQNTVFIRHVRSLRKCRNDINPSGCRTTKWAYFDKMDREKGGFGWLFSVSKCVGEWKSSV